jgi:hypothetical protein
VRRFGAKKRQHCRRRNRSSSPDGSESRSLPSLPLFRASQIVNQNPQHLFPSRVTLGANERAALFFKMIKGCNE